MSIRSPEVTPRKLGLSLQHFHSFLGMRADEVYIIVTGILLHEFVREANASEGGRKMVVLHHLSTETGSGIEALEYQQEG